MSFDDALAAGLLAIIFYRLSLDEVNRGFEPTEAQDEFDSAIGSLGQARAPLARLPSQHPSVVSRAPAIESMTIRRAGRLPRETLASVPAS